MLHSYTQEVNSYAKTKIGLALSLTIALGMGSNASAQTLENPGFETGDTSGWSIDLPSGGDAQVVTSYKACQAGNPDNDPSQFTGPLYNPKDGDYFLRIKTDGPGSYTKSYQKVTLNAGDTLSGWAVFDACDYIPFNDNASVEVYDASGNLIDIPWYSDVYQVGNYGETPWTSWSWTAPTPGTYTLVYKVANSLDGSLDAHALFDAPGATCLGLLCTIKASSDAGEFIIGTNGDDVICGGKGNDVILGAQGDDTICGGAGEDLLIGNEGYDLLEGQKGDDLLEGDNDVDVLHGGTGNDTLLGDAGNDFLFGTMGLDYLSGGAGSDLVNAGTDKDTCESESPISLLIGCEQVDPAGMGIFALEQKKLLPPAISESVKELEQMGILKR